MSERERQASAPKARWWYVAPAEDFQDVVRPVTCLAATACGAMRVAEAEHPYVYFYWPKLEASLGENGENDKTD